MDALHLLQNRTSSPALRAPAPSSDELELMFKAALRAPDHGALQPYRFLTIEGEALGKLGDLYLKANIVLPPVDKIDSELVEAMKKSLPQE